MNIIEKNLNRVYQQIRTIAKTYGRNPQDITLLAVSKNKSVKMIEISIAAGQRHFGENYVQEGVEKIRWFRKKPEVFSKLIWHFIGPLQTNKSRLVAEYFDWCHTLDRLKLAWRLNNQRPMKREPLNSLIQINISGENTKSGIAPEQMLSFARSISECPRLKLRGLMAIPAPSNNFQKQISAFNRMYILYEDLRLVYPNVDTLSLGMTNDMPAAIAAGSTMVRIGTSIFGKRNKVVRLDE